LRLAEEGAHHLVLHPGGEAVCITSWADENDAPESAVRLLVPDGSWQQSTRIANRLMQIPGAIRVRVTPRALVGLRRSPSPERACTAEAIASALDALGESQAARELRSALALMFERTRNARGAP